MMITRVLCICILVVCSYADGAAGSGVQQTALATADIRYAQNDRREPTETTEQTKVSLKEALDILEQDHDVRLNYLGKTVDGIDVNIPQKPFFDGDFQRRFNEFLAPLGLACEPSGKDSYVVYRSEKEMRPAGGISLQAIRFPRKEIAIPFREISGVRILQQNISGNVTDAEGEPLPGVSVLLKGTQNGTSTNMEGRFVLENVPGEAVLVFSLIGFRTEEVPVNGMTTLSVQMESDVAALEEVVVIGYGTTTRKDFTGSVSSLRLEDSPVALMPNVDVLQALKGSVPGLDIGASNAAGRQPGMQIRGQNSINGSNTPLIVLDGVIYFGALSDINPNDIATVDVLKDATSAAAYGSRSANGVIAITTKKGRTGKPLISIATSTGVQSWQNQPVMMKGEEWLRTVNARNQYAEDATNWLKSGELANREAGNETVWLDEITRTGVMQNYQASVSGAGEQMNYYFSAGYDDNKGVIIGDDFDRISLLAKLETDITSWLEVGLDGSFSRRDYSGAHESWVNAAMATAQTMSPYGVMFRDDQGNLEKYPYTQSSINPLWGLEDDLRDNLETRDYFRLNTHAVVRLPWVEGLSYRLNYQTNFDHFQRSEFTYEGYYVQEGEGLERYEPSVIQGFLTNARGNMYDSKVRNYVIDNILNYKRSFDQHDLDITLVATRDYLRYERVNTIGSDFASNGNTTLGYWGLHKATVQQNDLDAYETANVGYLGRLSYSFADKYYFTGSYRRDGASVFGTNNKWANFAAAGIAWRISNEDFMEAIAPLDDLKLKFSFGQNGNQGVDAYGTLSTVANSASGGVRYEFYDQPGVIHYGLYQNALGNSGLGWETTDSWNAGFESVWLNNRLFADVDIYFAKTRDQIFTRNIPVMTGFRTILASMGRVDNRGVEVTLRSVNVQSNDWHWNTSLSFWKNNNKLVELYGEDNDGDGREDDDLANGLFIGHSIEAIYGYVQDGIVQEGDTEYMELTGAAPGSPKYRDIDGEPGITAEDRQVLGYEEANFRMSLSNSVAYKQFDLYVMVTGVFGGNDRFLRSNTPAYMTSGTGRFNDNMTAKPYWTPENPSNVYPSAYFAGDGRYQALQSRGFVRIQDITLSYTFDQPWLQRLRMNGLKVFVSAKNLGTFTDWYGGDPETGARIRDNVLPVVSTYSAGLNVSF